MQRVYFPRSPACLLFFVSAKQNCSVHHGAEGKKLFSVTSQRLQEMALRYEYKHRGTNRKQPGKHRFPHPQINQTQGIIKNTLVR